MTALTTNRLTTALWFTACRSRSVCARTAKLGLSVGVLQAVLNQGDKWLDRSADSTVIAKSIISPLLTFSVAFVSAAATYVQRLQMHS